MYEENRINFSLHEEFKIKFYLKIDTDKRKNYFFFVCTKNNHFTIIIYITTVINIIYNNILRYFIVLIPNVMKLKNIYIPESVLPYSSFYKYVMVV